MSAAAAMPRTTPLPPVQFRQAADMLQFISSDEMQTWLAVGRALKAEFGETAFDMWDEWSQRAPNYESRKACHTWWKGFRDRVGGITIATVVKLARDGGYKFERETRLTEAEYKAREAAQRQANAERKARAEAARVQAVKDAAHAARAAMEDWRAAATEGESAYITRKGIERPESIRYAADGAVLVPMVRYDLPRERAFVGVQRIAPDGAKKFPFGTAKRGAACRIGLPVVGEPIFLCEGYATGMSIRMAIERLTGARKWPVFVAFDAYNLPQVAVFVHDLVPKSPIVICADDDWHTRVSGIPHNTGAIQAQLAQEAVMESGARLCVRMVAFFKHETKRHAKDTDFNDLHRLEGLDAVAAQLQVALDCIEEARSYG